MCFTCKSNSSYVLIVLLIFVSHTYNKMLHFNRCLLENLNISNKNSNKQCEKLLIYNRLNSSSQYSFSNVDSTKKLTYELTPNQLPTQNTDKAISLFYIYVITL